MQCLCGSTRELQVLCIKGQASVNQNCTNGMRMSVYIMHTSVSLFQLLLHSVCLIFHGMVLLVSSVCVSECVCASSHTV